MYFVCVCISVFIGLGTKIILNFACCSEARKSNKHLNKKKYFTLEALTATTLVSDQLLLRPQCKSPF